jgi:hypothetical protein
MNITADSLKKSVLAAGYKWNANEPNIVGIRTALQVPDVFNDLICLEYAGKLKVYTVTTEPGVYYQKKLLNPKGCAVLKPGQYIKAYAIGFHQNKTDHRALVQVGAVTVDRDGDMDGVAELDGKNVESGLFGINIHGANKLTKTDKIGAWSAGCQVFQNWTDKENFITILEAYKQQTGNRYTYTLLNENQLIS